MLTVLCCAELDKASRSQGQRMDHEEEAAVSAEGLWQHTCRHKVYRAEAKGNLLDRSRLASLL